jgi:peptidoglycan/xylan/chitin deacetylase (PgdA/CDA1 family)
MLTALRQFGGRALRSQPALRAGALRAGALVRSLERARPGLYTLCYHHVAAASKSRFAAQIALLKQFGTFVDADTASARLLSGRAAEGVAFLLTFDDGYADNVDIALPVIRQHRIPAMLFLVSDWLDAPPGQHSRATGYVTRADVGAWLDAGLSVGSHSATHRRFSGLSAAEAEAELRRSRAALSEIAGRPVEHFACPWGVATHDYAPARDPLLAREAGYRTFFTTRRGRALSEDDLLAMPRHVLEPEWDLYQLHTLLGGSRFARA